MISRLLSSLLLALLALPGRVLGAEGDMCYLTGVRSSIVDDKLYFMGGNYSIETADGQVMEARATLYHLELNSGFPVESAIPESALHASPIDRDETIAIAAYNVSTGEWSEVEVVDDRFNSGRRAVAQYATASEAGLGFILGGVLPTVGGMLRFDASGPENLSWTNETLGSGSNGIEVPNLQGGAMVYIPAGKQGILMTAHAAVYENNGFARTGADWLTVYVYDIESHTWWKQEASGDAPGGYRSSFGTAVSMSPDGSAFHITAYGGWENRRRPRGRLRPLDPVLSGQPDQRAELAWRQLSYVQGLADGCPGRESVGSSTGNAFATVPAAGFADPTLASLLQERVPTATSTPSPEDPANEDQDPGSETGESKTNTGAIAGGVVGGVAGLALLVAGIWFFLRQRKKKKKKKQPQQQQQQQEEEEEEGMSPNRTNKRPS
ncbi:hypothetical protein BJY01DRAFT_255506 [Aspergillus pseudoustus]|uniref:Kelch repeat protein n=1 Tax=Aspergillus pseudoustus TaxID=1810923 RepID=A0ABR4IMH1_9EURO